MLKFEDLRMNPDHSIVQIDANSLSTNPIEGDRSSKPVSRNGKKEKIKQRNINS